MTTIQTQLAPISSECEMCLAQVPDSKKTCLRCNILRTMVRISIVSMILENVIAEICNRIDPTHANSPMESIFVAIFLIFFSIAVFVPLFFYVPLMCRNVARLKTPKQFSKLYLLLMVWNGPAYKPQEQITLLTKEHTKKLRS